MSQPSTVAVIGGAMAGLAATAGFHDAGFGTTLYERQPYTDNRVNCGEAMTNVSAIPLEPTAKTGFSTRFTAVLLLKLPNRIQRAL